MSQAHGCLIEGPSPLLLPAVYDGERLNRCVVGLIDIIPIDVLSPSVWRSARRNTTRSVSAVSIAKGE